MPRTKQPQGSVACNSKHLFPAHEHAGWLVILWDLSYLEVLAAAQGKFFSLLTKAEGQWAVKALRPSAYN